MPRDIPVGNGNILVAKLKFGGQVLKNQFFAKRHQSP